VIHVLTRDKKGFSALDYAKKLAVTHPHYLKILQEKRVNEPLLLNQPAPLLIMSRKRKEIPEEQIQPTSTILQDSNKMQKRDVPEKDKVNALFEKVKLINSSSLQKNVLKT
jgi:hypothetical protein